MKEQIVEVWYNPTYLEYKNQTKEELQTYLDTINPKTYRRLELAFRIAEKVNLNLKDMVVKINTTQIVADYLERYEKTPSSSYYHRENRIRYYLKHGKWSRKNRIKSFLKEN